MLILALVMYYSSTYMSVFVEKSTAGPVVPWRLPWLSGVETWESSAAGVTLVALAENRLNSVRLT